MSTLSSEPPFPEVLLRSGHTSYEFVRRLGPARHGELVLARRRYDEGLGGFNIIKRPLPSTSEESRRRLLDEARVTSRLHHPNILAAQPLQGPEELPLLVLEHVSGSRLEAILAVSRRAGQPFSEAFACHMVAEVADALHHAHTLVDERGQELGIVHRDVTPHNILLGEHGEVKLLDFGAAWSRLPGRVISEGPAVQGSLAYAAPEHVHHLGLDGRADQFSLGIVLLQLLAGRHLFEGAELFDARQRQPHILEGTSTRLCAHELAERIRHYSVTDLEAATRAVPEALRPIVHRALAPERTRRFPTCAHLSRALREYLLDTQQLLSPREVLAEFSGLRYVAFRVTTGVAPDDVLHEHMLPEQPTPRTAPRSLSGHRAARPRGPSRRR